MLVVAAMAEVETKDIYTGGEERADHFLASARRSERGDDFGVTSTVCYSACRDIARVRGGASRLLHRALRIHGCRFASASISTARKSFTLVSVGPVTTESPSASKNPCPSLLAR